MGKAKANGTAGTRWTIGILFAVGSAIVGWTVAHHESDMLVVGEVQKDNAAAIGVIAERTVRLDANLANLTADVTEIKEGVKTMLERLPRRMKR